MPDKKRRAFKLKYEQWTLLLLIICIGLIVEGLLLCFMSGAIMNTIGFIMLLCAFAELPLVVWRTKQHADRVNAEQEKIFGKET